jgi:F-type H+-transporting ATPase subunit delta
MSNPTHIAQTLYQATVKELSAAHDPTLQREVLKSLDGMLKTGAQNVAVITSAVELTSAEKAALEQKLRAKFNANLTFEYKVDVALLGGVVVKVGDKIIDGSLANKLNAMRETLLGGTR